VVKNLFGIGDVLSMGEKTFVRLELCAVTIAGGRVMCMGMKAA
jgi:hypothetical protein